MADNWNDAVKEWSVIKGCDEDEKCLSTCVCGHSGIRYLYTIHNDVTDADLSPIGSSCITKIDNRELSKSLSTWQQLIKLVKRAKRHERIELTSEYFSRNLLKLLKDQGAFQPSIYNKLNGDNDYLFMIDMFNKRDKSSISPHMNSKIDAIIVSSLKPFLSKYSDED